MIQIGTYINIIDNSGAKIVVCLHILNRDKSKYAQIGDTVLVSIKQLRLKRRNTSKVKKGEIHKALIMRTKCFLKKFSGSSLKFFENAAVLINTQNKLIGTRIFGTTLKIFRYSKFLRVISLSIGVS